MSMRMPLDYIGIVRGFSSGHHGVDFGWNAQYGGPGHLILAADAGVVTTVIISARNNYEQYRQGLEYAVYGTYVVLDHGSGLVTLYGHLDATSVRVKTGDRVAQGQQLARMGNTGTSSGTHLHFEVRKNGSKVNGLEYVKVFPGQTVSEKSNLKDQLQYESEPLETVGTPVRRDETRDQIEVRIENLRARSGAYLMDNVLGWMKPGIYDAVEIRDMRAEESNGYLWYRTQDDYWCAQVEGVDFLPAAKPEPDPDPEPDDSGDWAAVYDIAKKHVEEGEPQA